MNRTSRIAAATAAAILPVALVTPAATSAPAPSRGDLVEIPAKAALQEAVDPSPCEATALDEYVDGLLNDMSDEQYAFLVKHQVALLNVPTYDALFFGSTSDPDYALESHAQQLRHTFRDLTRFWSDVKSDDIQLMAMHGESLLDADRVERTLTAMAEFGLMAPMTAEQISKEAQTVATWMSKQGDFYDNPFWTLNAFAFSGAGDPDPAVEAMPDKLVFGDGILEAYDAMGLGDVGPRVIMGHEFAHHIQFELGTFESGPSDPSAATRRTELMADAMAAYFGVHKKGLSFNKKRVVDALLSFYTVGDCSWNSSGHHGTPLQRERAADWGADLAAAAKPASYVLPAKTVEEKFEAALDGIISGS